MAGEDANSDVNHDCWTQEESTSALSAISRAQKHAAIFLLKLKETRIVLQLAIDDLINDIPSMIQCEVARLQTIVDLILKKNGLSMSAISGLQNAFSVVNPFAQLSSNYLQKFYKDQFQLLEPETILLGRRTALVLRVSRPFLKYTPVYMYHIPLLISLNALLKQPIVLKEVMCGHSQTDGQLGDYCDGSNFKAHPLYSKGPNSLQVMLYYDDLEVCNPPGMKVKLHKLGN
uniref:Uncharacterized protein n=1 Tax=Amphimedon queenslandica TaxID=400682 RepID=A0A1X7UMD5_AMPQE